MEHIKTLKDAGLDPWAVSVHEAAHAVVAWTLDVPVYEIRIGICEQVEHGVRHGGVELVAVDGLARIWTAIGRSHRTRQHALNASAITLFAGEEAERQIIGEVDEESGSSDLAKIGDIIDELCGSGDAMTYVIDYCRHHNRMLAVTRRIVRSKTDTIKNLAGALMASGTLDFDEVAKLCGVGARRTA
jgi:hypothetical protein